MERIKQAVERARQQGTGAAATKPQSSVVVAAPSTEMPARVQYTQTRVITLDQDHLADNRIMSDNSDHPAAAAYQLLRTQILHKPPGAGLEFPGRNQSRARRGQNDNGCKPGNQSGQRSQSHRVAGRFRYA